MQNSEVFKSRLKGWGDNDWVRACLASMGTWVSHTDMNTLVLAAHAYNPDARGLTRQQSSLTGEFQVSERCRLKEVGGVSEMTLRGDLWSAHSHAPPDTCMNTRTHVYEHTHTPSTP